MQQQLPLLSRAEIRQRLAVIRHSNRRLRNQRAATSMNGLAKAAGISIPAIYRAARGDRFGPDVQAALSAVLHLYPME